MFNEPGRAQAKWWRVEVQFASTPTPGRRRAVERRFEAAFGWWSPPVLVGIDGIIFEQWPEKWPTADLDAQTLAYALTAAGVDYRVRAAPFGHRCELCENRFPRGDSFACDPVFTDGDWEPVGNTTHWRPWKAATEAC